MIVPTVRRLRGKQARIAVAYSTKDRVDYTRRTFEAIARTPGVDLYWFDGSTNRASRELIDGYAARTPNLCEVHLNVIGGPDAAILTMLSYLDHKEYDYVVLVENDILVEPCWLEAMLESIALAEAEGFTVGAASCRVYAERVLARRPGFCLLSNAGAGFFCVRGSLIKTVVENYRSVMAAEYFSHFRFVAGVDLTGRSIFPPQQQLSADWFFDMALYNEGYVVVSPPTSQAANIDDVPGGRLVLRPEDHLLASAAAEVSAAGLRPARSPTIRFQRSPFSERMMIGVHQLALGFDVAAADAMVGFTGRWWRIWNQVLGPFALEGAGEIRIRNFGQPMGLMLRINGSVTANHLDGRGAVWRSQVLVADDAQAGLCEFALESDPADAGDVRIAFEGNNVTVIGLLVAADALQFYRSQRTRIDHLPFDIPTDFDAEAYLARNPDVKAARMDPRYHYLRFGIKEGRRWE